jgi:hypothetical protein
MEANNQLELRMYFFVPYNISPIQQAIQAGHAALEYANKFKDDPEFIDFVENYKTWIILNGGTTNDMIDVDGCYYGTLNQLEGQLSPAGNDHKIHYSTFREPDLNNALTALCFIVDERVFNKKDYPDFKYFAIQELGDSRLESIVLSEDSLKEEFPTTYEKWLKLIGGKKNEFLKQLLKDKKLA